MKQEQSTGHAPEAFEVKKKAEYKSMSYTRGLEEQQWEADG